MLSGTEMSEIVKAGNPHHALKGGKGVLPVTARLAEEAGF